MSRELVSKRASLATIEKILKDALTRRNPPWTAISALTRQQAKLAAEVAAMEGEEEKTEGLTADRLKRAIANLPADLVPVAETALIERKRR